MREIGFVVFPGFQIMSLAAMSVFEFANLNVDEPAYAMRLMSERGGPIANSLGLRVETDAIGDSEFDTVLVGGPTGIPPAMPGLEAYLAQAQTRTRRLAAICTGAFVFARAGLLDGRRATTHWRFARELKQTCPAAQVEEDRIFIVDGAVWTSAGMSAGVDLALAIVENDFGLDTSRMVARKLVLYQRRGGGQSQFSALLEMGARSDRVQMALTYASENLASDLSVERLAEAARLSPRQFSRVFREETGQSPAKAVERLRVEAARLMMETTRHPIEIVARETGFGDRERMRQAFLRAFGQPPQTIQRASGVTPLAL